MTNRTGSERQVSGTSGRILREEIRVRLDPETFLRWGAGSPRGFWAHRDGWVAHVGEIASLEIERPSSGGARFREMEAQARDLFARGPESGTPPESDAGSNEAPATPRLYGGFSFRDDHTATGFWEDFPPARFLLPELELERTKEGTFLRAQLRLDDAGQAGDAADEARVRERLRARLEEVRRAILAESPPESGGIGATSANGAASGSGHSPGEALFRNGTSGSSHAPTHAPSPVSLNDARLSGHVETEQAAWEATVVKALAAIRAGEVEKVVLARTLDVTPAEPLDAVEVFMHLRRENRGAHVFLFEPVPGAPFIGAAPETVVTLLDGIFRATAVAGSITGGENGAERAAFARQLLESGKDRVEHAYTVEEILRCLKPLAEEISVDSEPHVLSLARIQHLETRVRARARPGETVLSLLAALHPTPAVCGLPRDEALAFLREEEPFERGWYAGPVGWFDGEGNGVFVPALRSAVASEGRWRLIAGAGIVPGSHPESEWDETGMKFQPVLRALARSRPLV